MKESGRCCASDEREHCRNSFPSTLRSTIISTRNATSTAEKTSSLTALPLSLSGANSVRHNATVTGHSETGSYLSDSTVDDVTGRTVALPALEKAQAAWLAYRAIHCDYVGATFGGGSGTGIGINSCRIELGRSRAELLMRYAQDFCAVSLS